MNPLLIAPALLFTMGVIIGLLWFATRRQNPHLALIAAGFIFFACAVAVQLAYIPNEVRANAVVSAAIYSAGATLFSLGIIARSRLPGGHRPLLVISVALVIGIFWYAYVDRQLVPRVYILNFGVAAILLYASWRTRKLISGSIADRILFWSLLGVGLHFFPRTQLTVQSIASATVADFSDTSFWILTLYVISIFTIILGISIIVVTGLDALAAVKRERDTDSLTGVRNRRSLEGLLSRTAAFRQPVSLLMCDLDHFKRINDTYGHHGGDIVLKSFVDNLVATVGQEGIVARLGGEEFVVVMPGADITRAVSLAERILASTSQVRAHSIAPGLIVRCSIGAVEIGDDEDPWAAMRRMDDLLYKAKQAGRNRVVSELDFENSATSMPNPVQQATMVANQRGH